MMTQNPWHRLSTMIAIGAVLTGCSSYMSTNPQNSGDTKIQALPSLAFSPSSVTISSGETVTWVFGTVGETVIFDSGRRGAEQHRQREQPAVERVRRPDLQFGR